MSAADSAIKPTIHLCDYWPSAWSIDEIALEFDLDPLLTVVKARLLARQDPAQADAPLQLDGEGIELLEILVDGRKLSATEYQCDSRGLTVPGLTGQVVVETLSRIRPSANSAMQGLYLSGSYEEGFLLTQCEAEGFRNITWSIDRPDVLARYTVTLRADRARFPVLLAGGDADGSGELEDGRHWARFVDPQPRPSYLFALVAGRLESIEDHFDTAEGRRVRLVIWAEANAIDRCVHAMTCLKASFEWDEQRFGRSYRLDTFHVVATHDFTMGAMENTGLNIFNSKYLLADPEHATDDDYRHVLAVVAHEYFHNWTGNRVTCRDWFQLSLKEGLTVYREQEFESDVASRTLRRIEDVRILWRVQFGEDAGPLAHPVRPEQYSEINNFYTATIYEKGAEIVRMLATLLGREGFRRGMDLYFERHDGQAVTVEHFLAALGDANDRDLTPWLAWYRQAGTPVLEAHGRYDAASQCYELTLNQHTRPTPDGSRKEALPIPIAMALFDREGHALPLALEGADDNGAHEQVLLLDRAQATFRFHGLASDPVPSLLRGYSAPVRFAPTSDWQALAVLVAHESDGFNRWFAGDALAKHLYAGTLAHGRPDAMALAAWTGSLRAAFADTALDPATLAEMLTLADEGSLAEPLSDINPDAVHRARDELESQLAHALELELIERYESLAPASGEGSTPVAQARRRLRNRCLLLLCRVGPRHRERARLHYAVAATLSDRLAALTSLVHGEDVEAQTVLDDFAARYRDDPLVLDKWFAVQATIPRADTLERVDALTSHPAFRWENPNKVYALVLSFAQRNPLAFHRADGAGYRFVGDAIVKLNAITPQVAARLTTSFGAWRRYEPGRRALMRAELRRLQNEDSLSADVGDIVSRSLGDE
jgi:aminopeptidase N